jgi:hypothetical protein
MGSECPIVSLGNALAFDARDWSKSKRDAWIYGVVLGWDEALSEVAEAHGWDAETQRRLVRLHERFMAMATANPEE